MSKYLKEPAAFPSVVDGYIQDGMTLRDYFAAKAMQGLLANSETNRAWGVNENAKYAYEQADAMLKARGEL